MADIFEGNIKFEDKFQLLEGQVLYLVVNG